MDKKLMFDYRFKILKKTGKNGISFLKNSECMCQGHTFTHKDNIHLTENKSKYKKNIMRMLTKLILIQFI